MPRLACTKSTWERTAGRGGLLASAQLGASPPGPGSACHGTWVGPDLRRFLGLLAFCREDFRPWPLRPLFLRLRGCALPLLSLQVLGAVLTPGEAYWSCTQQAHALRVQSACFVHRDQSSVC